MQKSLDIWGEEMNAIRAKHIQQSLLKRKLMNQTKNDKTKKK